MFSFKSIVLIAAAFAVGAESSAVAVPAVAAAPLVAPAHVGYAQTIPQNVPPFASQVSVVNRAVSPLVASPFAAPYIAGPAPYAAHYAYAAGHIAPAAYAAGPLAPAAYAAPAFAPAAYAAAPAAYAAAPFAAPAAFPAPLPLGPAPLPLGPAPLLRAPFSVAPAFVR